MPLGDALRKFALICQKLNELKRIRCSHSMSVRAIQATPIECGKEEAGAEPLWQKPSHQPYDSNKNPFTKASSDRLVVHAHVYVHSPSAESSLLEELNMSGDPNWQPTLIDIEEKFSEFVPTFRNGRIVRELIPDQPIMTLNADFYFPDDRIVAELKCMEKDSRDTYHERILQAFAHFGHSGGDVMGFLFRGEPMPQRVAARLRQQIGNPLRQALRKANKQIAATKHHLKVPDGFGLAVFANDNNFGLTPADSLAILSKAALGLSTCHVDGIVYTTPNIYHDSGDNIARSIWTPMYAKGKEALADFVNPLGTAWIDYAEQFGDPYLERWTVDELDECHLNSKPIAHFRRIRN